MGGVIEEFFVRLGFVVDPSGLDEMEGKLSGLKSLMLGFGAAVTAAAGAVGALAITTANQIDELSDFADLNSVSIKSLQELGYAAEQSDSSLQAVKNSVVGLNNILGSAAMGIGRGAKIFEKMGFEARDAEGKVKNVGDLLFEVSERIKTMSKPEALAMLVRLGIDPTLLPLLQRSTEEIQGLRNEMNALGIASEKDAKIADTLTKNIAKFYTIINALKMRIGAELMPAVNGIIASINKWVIANGELIQSGLHSFLGFLVSVIRSTWSAVSELIDGLIEAVRWFVALKVQTGTVTEIFNRITGAISRVIESVKLWVDQNQELIKTLASATFTVFGAIIEWLATGLIDLVDAFIDVVAWINQFVDLINLARGALALLIVAKIGAFFGALATSIGAVTTALLSFNGVLAGTNAGLFLANLTLGGLVLAIGFLIYELNQYYKGNDSLLTQLAEKLPIAVDIAKGALIALTLVFFALRVQGVAHLLALVGQAVVGFLTIGAQALLAGAKMALGWVIGMGPLGWVIAAVSIAAGLIFAYWDELSAKIPQSWKTAWDTVLATFDAFIAWSRAELDAFEAWFDGKWDNLTESIKTGWKEAWDLVANVAQVAMTTVQSVIDLFDISGFLDKVQRMGSALRDFLGINSAPTTPHSLSDLSARKGGMQQNSTTPRPGSTNAAGQVVALGDVGIPGGLGTVQQNNVYNIDRAPYQQQPLISPIGVLGRAETALYNTQNAASSVTQTTNISGTQIHITAPDPIAAGTEVKKQMERMTKRATRNGQTAVAL